MDLPAPQSYSPATFRPLTFHDAVPRFLDGSDTPRAYLERCLATIAEREPQVQAFASLNEDGARAAGAEVILGLRPEHIRAGSGAGVDFTATVQVVEPLGADTLVHFSIGDAVLTARLEPQNQPEPGSRIGLTIAPQHLSLFDAQTERALAHFAIEKSGRSWLWRNTENTAMPGLWSMA